MTRARLLRTAQILAALCALAPPRTAPAQPTPEAPSTPAPAPASSAPAPASSAPAPASHGPAAPQPLAPGASQRTLGGPYTSSAAPYDGPPVLFGTGRHRLGAYGEAGVDYTHMVHRDGALASLGAGLLVDHRLSLGAAVYAFSRTPRGPAASDGTPRHFSTGYGGLRFAYAAFTDFPIYASLGVLVGGGVLTLDERPSTYDRSDIYGGHITEYRPRRERTQGYFVAQPELSLHANATRWLRLTVTGGYRFASGVPGFDYDSTAMSGAVVGGSVALGWF